MSTSATPASNPSTSATASPPAGMFEKVLFERVFAGLEANGITLTAAEKQRLREISEEEIRKQNSGLLVGTNVGGAGINLIQILLSFIQNLFSHGSGTPFMLAGLPEQLSAAASNATNSGKQQVITTISANIHERLKAENGNLAQAADLITGLSDGQGYARDIGNGTALISQLQAASNIPAGTTSTLNPASTPAGQMVASNQNIGNGLPPQVTRPLTPATPSV